MYKPKSESKLFENLDSVLSIFRYYEIPYTLDLLVSDHELAFYSTYIPIEDLEKNQVRLLNYISDVRKRIDEKGLAASIARMSDLLDDKYMILFRNIVQMLESGKIKYDTPSGGGVGNLTIPTLQAAIDRVYETQRLITSYEPSRKDISYERTRVYASALALQSVLEDLYPENCLLIEDSRGNENSFIASGIDGKQPCSIFFTHLRG